MKTIQEVDEHLDRVLERQWQMSQRTLFLLIEKRQKEWREMGKKKQVHLSEVAFQKSDDDGVLVGVVDVEYKSAKALLVIFDGEKKWIPLSQITEDSEVGEWSSKGDSGVLMVSQWFGKQLGIDDE